MRIACRLGSQNRHSDVSKLIPVWVKVESAFVEEGMSGDVRRLSLHVIQLVVERPSQRIYSQQIHATVSDKCRAGGESIQCPLQAGAWCPTLRTAPFGWSANRACRICQVEEVGALSFLQLQCLSESVEQFRCGSDDRAAFKFGVVHTADPRQYAYLANA